ncbi:hypothetical protein N7516_008154, partial [Penicillium verrucosum]|uniref:uncharacterized protein n=1 Tax=Penicillium verrucosum TaxID=60171 RepID=UPI0025453511
ERGDAKIVYNKVLYRFVGGFIQLRFKVLVDIRYESLVQLPEYILPYRHIIYNNYVIIYRTKSPRTEYYIDLPKYLIYNKAINLTIQRRISGISIVYIADLFAGTSIIRLGKTRGYLIKSSRPLTPNIRYHDDKLYYFFRSKSLLSFSTL